MFFIVVFVVVVIWIIVLMVGIDNNVFVLFEFGIIFGVIICFVG